MTEQEIEKLAEKYIQQWQNDCKEHWGKMVKDLEYREHHNKTNLSGFDVPEGYQLTDRMIEFAKEYQALSNPDYILIEKEYIESKIQELEKEYFRLKSLNVDEADIQFLDGARTHVKDILSNSKVT